MNKKKYLVGALAALMMVGCTDDITENGGGGLEGITGNSFVKIALNLPTASGIGTRAENDIFDDGTADEYAVTSTKLIIFKGTGESDASVAEVVDLGLTSDNYGLVGSNDDNITTSADATVQITTTTTDGENLYGLVVVNGTVNSTTTDGTTSVTINGQSISDFEDLFTVQENATLSNYIGTDKDNFLMLNAPLLVEGKSVSSSMQAGDVMTLVELTPYPTYEEAAMAPATDIWVERAVAKVTVGQGTFTPSEATEGELVGKYYMDVDNDGSIYNDDRAYLMGWYLNVTNKSTKVGHDVYGTGDSPAYLTWVSYANATDSETRNRFISADSRRVYWGIDGNYDGQNYSEEFNIVTQGNEPSNDLKPDGKLFDNPVYCFENTMNYDQMEQDQTTGIVFEMKYMFDANGEPETFFTMPNSSEPKKSYYQDAFIEAINTALGNASAGFKVKLKGELSSIEGGYYTTNADIEKLFDIDDSEGTSTFVEGLTEEQAAAILNAVGGAINVYENGTTYYYAARIQHFGDTYCEVENDYVDDASDYEAGHLGRYGVLRNNWYEIVVNSISGPGMPERPDPTPDPGDEPDPDDPKEENYIKCNINVLSWAVRNQNVDL